MVSLWPWRRVDSSPASFEKTLSALSAKISRQATTLDARRNQARRIRALWTLYAAIAYLLYLVVAVFVVGWRAWGSVEYGTAVGGPVVIYGVRRALDAAFGYRVGAAETRLQDLKQQRDKTIAQLKEATRYDSTQALLDKYAGEKGARKRNVRSSEGQDDNDSGTSTARRQGGQQQKPPRTTGFAPPPTANIPGRQSLPAHFSPGWHGQGSGQQPSSPATPPSQQRDPLAPSASFAPNAFPAGSPQAEAAQGQQSHPREHTQPRPLSPPEHRSPLSQQLSPPSSPGPYGHGESGSYGGGESGSGSGAGGGAWYDRLLDVLLGDDESAARNRLALLCTSCGQVNGLAPPGTKTAAQLGRWRCANCGAWNGVRKEEHDEHDEDEEEHGEGVTRRKRKNPKKRRDTMDAVVQEIRDATGASPDEIRRRMGDIPTQNEEEEESDRTVYTDEEEEDAEVERKEVEEEESDDSENSSPAKATRAQKARKRNETPPATKGKKKGQGSKGR